MSQFFLFFALFVLCVNSDRTIRPKKYCKLYCGKIKATGCKCNLKGRRTESELNKIIEFRQLCLHEHNRWRNYIASGNETRGSAKSVADMMVMNYDLELEYLARCYGRSTFNGDYDKCRKLQNGRDAGQNIAGVSYQDLRLGRAKNGICRWYNEVKYMEKDIYSKWHTGKNNKIEQFTAMCWGVANLVGCAHIYTSDTKKQGFVEKNYETALICNYAVRDIKGNINSPGASMYTLGNPCSKCPEGEKYNKCNSNYTALCGVLEPVPKDKPYQFSSSTKLCANITLLVLTWIILVLT
ncbi:venom allergen 5 2-like [Tribolium madens]|uniref:venom allergen 5 2-like n=1 Tax=Tribolium madens TaxID=41895 RepID=UPI001CF765FA|nr:venom allergen 5 2-like [Tribolium madens]